MKNNSLSHVFQAYLKDNFYKPRGPQHINYYIVVITIGGKKMYECEMRYTEE